MVREELRELKAWRSRQALAVVILFGLVVPATTGLGLFALLRPGLFLTGPGLVVLPVLLLWIWLLRRAPRRWWQAQQDRKSGEIREWRGPVALIERPGLGIIRIPRHDLLLDGRRFPISRFWAEQIVPGLEYTVRYAPQSRAVLSLQRQGRAGRTVRADTTYQLSRREKELLRYIAEGLTDKEIARVLNLAPATVRTYNSDLYAKLGIERRTQAVPIAQELGLRGSENPPGLKPDSADRPD